MSIPKACSKNSTWPEEPTTTLAIFVTIWFSIGGIKDIRRMFGRLRLMKRDETDDGMIRETPAEEEGV